MNKTGLVLAGGGGKGAYHIGVWKVLEEYGVSNSISCVAGTSIGALNAALFLQGSVFDAERIWRSISNDKILTINKSELFKDIVRNMNISDIPNYMMYKDKVSVFSRKGLKTIIDENVDLDKIVSSPIKAYGACATGMVKNLNEIVYFPYNNITTERLEKILFASSAIPIGFEPVEIDNKVYIDGGVLDNVPVKPVYDEGCNIIIVVHLGIGQPIDWSIYPDANIIEIFPSEGLGGFINGTIDFEPDSISKRIDLGYRDAKRIMEPIMKMIMTQGRLMKSFEQMKKDEKDYLDRKHELRRERDALKAELDMLIRGE